MVFLLAYAVLIWFIAVRFRRSWPAFVAPVVSLIPIFILTWMSVEHWGREPGEPPATWIYIPAGAYAALIVFVSYFIACIPRTRNESTCDFCAYDLAGLPTERCPECGRIAGQHRLGPIPANYQPPPSEISLAGQLMLARDVRDRRSLDSTNDSAATSSAPTTAAPTTKKTKRGWLSPID